MTTGSGISLAQVQREKNEILNALLRLATDPAVTSFTPQIRPETRQIVTKVILNYTDLKLIPNSAI